MDIEAQKKLAEAWFRELRDKICAEYEKIETELTGTGSDKPAGKFERTKWKREEGGGGEMSVLRGRVFEKVGVNISTVFGEFSEAFRKEIPGAAEDPRFFATGVSLVSHPLNPHVPIAHMNTRFIVTSKNWFGGGGDLTPVFPIEKDTKDFHAEFKQVCDKFDADYYPKFSKWCDEYFFIKHRNEMRGVGGIFYDYLYSSKPEGCDEDRSKATAERGGLGENPPMRDKIIEGDFAQNFEFTKAVGLAFHKAYPEIIRRHMNKSWTEEDKQKQLIKRGRYAEFNLVYDRGTRFGLMTGGNTEAILMSLPPMATWP